ncbi:hypothetical protein PhiSM_gp75 [Cellulophaga phage phiSM]|nr:hypothetical protein PhiSM_gp75 [Cellulophaga phage phiSM]AGO49394.1 hypothetical protein Phi3:1_gp75 [Cellulophaga phage phi3:1]
MNTQEIKLRQKLWRIFEIAFVDIREEYLKDYTLWAEADNLDRRKRFKKAIDYFLHLNMSESNQGYKEAKTLFDRRVETLKLMEASAKRVETIKRINLNNAHRLFDNQSNFLINKLIRDYNLTLERLNMRLVEQSENKVLFTLRNSNYGRIKITFVKHRQLDSELPCVTFIVDSKNF